MKRLALVAGSNGPSWATPLRFADHDAARMASVLENHCGYTVDRVTPNTSSMEVFSRAERMAAEADVGDQLIFYFSGHGYLHYGKLFLLVSSSTDRIFGSAVYAKQLIDQLELSPATFKLLILDCCHAGGAVGFKDAGMPLAIDATDTQLVLCASNRLELAREFEDLRASFLTHELCEILEHTRGEVTLSKAVEVLATRARERSTQGVAQRVPIPYLFGAAAAPFILKRPVGLQPIQLRFAGPATLDGATFHDSLAPFMKWDITSILDRCPVEISYTAEINDRASTINEYLRTDQWPTEISDETRKQFAMLTQETLQEFADRATKATRLAIAAGLPPERDRLDPLSEQILKIYLRAIGFSLFRLYSSMWLIGEPKSEPFAQFPELDTCFSLNPIHGLPWTLQSETPVSFWTDADLRYEGQNYRIYVPQKFGRGPDEWDASGEVELSSFIGPQMLEHLTKVRGGLSTFARLTRKPSDADITIRGGVFIETESFNFPSSSADVRQRAAQIAAEAVMQYLDTSADPYFRFRVGLGRWDQDLKISDRVKTLAEEGRTPLARRVRGKLKI